MSDTDSSANHQDSEYEHTAVLASSSGCAGQCYQGAGRQSLPQAQQFEVSMLMQGNGKEM